MFNYTIHTIHIVKQFPLAAERLYIGLDNLLTKDSKS